MSASSSISSQELSFDEKLLLLSGTPLSTPTDTPISRVFSYFGKPSTATSSTTATLVRRSSTASLPSSEDDDLETPLDAPQRGRCMIRTGSSVNRGDVVVEAFALKGVEMVEEEQGQEQEEEEEQGWVNVLHKVERKGVLTRLWSWWTKEAKKAERSDALMRAPAAKEPVSWSPVAPWALLVGGFVLLHVFVEVVIPTIAVVLVLLACDYVWTSFVVPAAQFVQKVFRTISQALAAATKSLGHTLITAILTVLSLPDRLDHLILTIWRTTMAFFAYVTSRAFQRDFIASLAHIDANYLDGKYATVFRADGTLDTDEWERILSEPLVRGAQGAVGGLKALVGC